MTGSISDIYDIITEKETGAQSAAYKEKMLHPVPETKVVDRDKFIIEACKDKVVIDIGCTGTNSPTQLHQAILKVGKEVWGIDKEKCDTPHFIEMDVEMGDFNSITVKPDVVICGELLEHLSNAGLFMTNLKAFACPIIITVPNALTIAGYKHIDKHVENVSKDHVAYYSYTTFKELARRHDFKITEFWWYNGKPLIAEGLVFVVEKENGNS